MVAAGGLHRMLTLLKGSLPLLPAGAGTMFGGMAILYYTPVPQPVALLAATGFGASWTLAIYLLGRRFGWLPAVPQEAVALEANLGRILILVAVVVLSTLGAVLLFLYTPGPLATDVFVTLGFTAAIVFGTYSVLRRQ